VKGRSAYWGGQMEMPFPEERVKYLQKLFGITDEEIAPFVREAMEKRIAERREKERDADNIFHGAMNALKFDIAPQLWVTDDLRRLAEEYCADPTRGRGLKDAVAEAFGFVAKRKAVR
jgi:hypothetical protein